MLASPSRYLGPDPRGEERLDKPKGCPHVSPYYNAADPIIINGKGIDPFELSEGNQFHDVHRFGQKHDHAMRYNDANFKSSNGF
uniref:Uncharacterized protein n=1 Tax=Oryza rufipogon TaxID=4529 RepID=A0A0E0QXU9_ORYRU